MKVMLTEEAALAMAERGAAILDRCAELGDWTGLVMQADFESLEHAPVALISPTSNVGDGLARLGISYQDAHDTLLIPRGDVTPKDAVRIWKQVAGGRMLEASRT